MSKRLSLANLLSHLPTTYLHTYLVMSPTDIAVYKITVCSKGTLPIILTKCYSLAIPMINKQKHIPSPWMPSTTTLDQRPISRKRLDCHHEELRLITSISFNCRPPTPCPRATAQPSFTSRPLRKPQPLTLPTPPPPPPQHTQTPACDSEAHDSISDPKAQRTSRETPPARTLRHCMGESAKLILYVHILKSSEGSTLAVKLIKF